MKYTTSPDQKFENLLSALLAVAVVVFWVVVLNAPRP